MQRGTLYYQHLDFGHIQWCYVYDAQDRSHDRVRVRTFTMDDAGVWCGVRDVEWKVDTARAVWRNLMHGPALVSFGPGTGPITENIPAVANIGVSDDGNAW